MHSLTPSAPKIHSLRQGQTAYQPLRMGAQRPSLNPTSSPEQGGCGIEVERRDLRRQGKDFLHENRLEPGLRIFTELLKQGEQLAERAKQQREETSPQYLQYLLENAMDLHTLGSIYQKKKDYPRAESHLLSALDTYQTIGYKRLDTSYGLHKPSYPLEVSTTLQALAEVYIAGFKEQQLHFMKPKASSHIHLKSLENLNTTLFREESTFLKRAERLLKEAQFALQRCLDYERQNLSETQLEQIPQQQRIIETRLKEIDPFITKEESRLKNREALQIVQFPAPELSDWIQNYKYAELSSYYTNHHQVKPGSRTIELHVDQARKLLNEVLRKDTIANSHFPSLFTSDTIRDHINLAVIAQLGLLLVKGDTDYKVQEFFKLAEKHYREASRLLDAHYQEGPFKQYTTMVIENNMAMLKMRAYKNDQDTEIIKNNKLIQPHLEKALDLAKNIFKSIDYSCKQDWVPLYTILNNYKIFGEKRLSKENKDKLVDRLTKLNKANNYNLPLHRTAGEFGLLSLPSTIK